MGKRKSSSRKPQGPKKREPLATTFNCLFCNHDNSVTVKLYKGKGTGRLDCKVCGQYYESRINYLSAAVDVYSDWIDACEEVAREAETDERGVTKKDREFSDYAAGGAQRSGGPGRAGRIDEEEEDDDALAEDDEY